MGIYDRDYIREDAPRSGFASWSMVSKLIVINVAVWVLDLFTDPVSPYSRWLDFHLALQPDVLTHPWNLWQLVTNGFAHDPANIKHILFNMFSLWLFGTDVERIYGSKEFLRLYLSILVSEGLLWAVIQLALPPEKRIPVIGASGAIAGIMAVYIFHFPHRQFLLFFVIPVPAWLLGVGYLAWDFFGEVAPGAGDNVAHLCHLAGAFFGVLYYRTGWCLASLIPQKWSLSGLRRRTKLRVHREQDDGPDEPVTQQRVDELLAKISREGESSLTDKERRELEEASRRYRGHQRRQ